MLLQLFFQKCTRYSSMQRYIGKWMLCDVSDSLRKQPTSREVATWTLTKWRLSNKRRNSILMTCHYPDLGSASDWLKGNSHAFTQTSFCKGSSGDLANCRLFSQTMILSTYRFSLCTSRIPTIRKIYPKKSWDNSWGFATKIMKKFSQMESPGLETKIAKKLCKMQIVRL